MEFLALHLACVGAGKDGISLVWFCFFPVVFGSGRTVIIKKSPVLLSYLFPGTLSGESKLFLELFSGLYALVFAGGHLLQLPV